MELTKLNFCINFSKLNPQTAEDLSRLASKTNIPIQDKSIEAAIENGILSVGGEFPDIEFENFFIALKYLDEIGETSYEINCFGFLISYRSTHHKKLKNVLGHDYLSSTMLILHHIHKINIPELINSAPGIDRYISTRIFPIMQYFFVDNETLANTIITVTEGIKAEDNYIDLNQTLFDISKQNTGFIQILYSKISESAEKLLLLFPYSLAGKSSTDGLNSCLKIIKELFESDIISKQKCALRSLSTLQEIKPNDFKVFEGLFSTFNHLADNASPEVLFDLFWVYYIHSQYLPGSKEKILETCKNRRHDLSNYALSVLILREIYNTSETKWVSDALSILVKLGNLNPQTIDRIEAGLCKILETNKQFVFDFLYSFISEEKVDIASIQGLKNVFSNLYSNDKAALEKCITTWLTHDNIRFHVAFLYVTSGLWAEDMKELKLSKTLLDTLSSSDLEYICYKIAGWSQSKEFLENLIFSILKSKKADKKIQFIVIDLFCNHIIYNYPSSIDFLREKKKDCSKVEAQVINEIIRYDEEKSKIKLTKPNELKPSFDRLNSTFQKEVEDSITSKSENKFREPSFMDHFPKVVLKFKGTHFMRNDYYGVKDRYLERHKLSLIEQNFEFPSGVFIDPIGARYQQIVWRTFKRTKR